MSGVRGRKGQSHTILHSFPCFWVWNVFFDAKIYILEFNQWHFTAGWNLHIWIKCELHKHNSWKSPIWGTLSGSGLGPTDILVYKGLCDRRRVPCLLVPGSPICLLSSSTLSTELTWRVWFHTPHLHREWRVTFSGLSRQIIDLLLLWMTTSLGDMIWWKRWQSCESNHCGFISLWYSQVGIN